MKDKEPLAERIVKALREHGKLTLEQIAKHADTSVATLYTMMGTLKKHHGVARAGSEGKAAIYGFAVKGAPQQRKSKKKRAAPKTRSKKGEASDALTGTVRDLKRRREALMDDVSKLDRAIEAVEALAA